MRMPHYDCLSFVDGTPFLWRPIDPWRYAHPWHTNSGIPTHTRMVNNTCRRYVSACRHSHLRVCIPEYAYALLSPHLSLKATETFFNATYMYKTICCLQNSKTKCGASAFSLDSVFKSFPSAFFPSCRSVHTHTYAVRSRKFEFGVVLVRSL